MDDYREIGSQSAIIFIKRTNVSKMSTKKESQSVARAWLVLGGRRSDGDSKIHSSLRSLSNYGPEYGTLYRNKNIVARDPSHQQNVTVIDEV